MQRTYRAAGVVNPEGTTRPTSTSLADVKKLFFCSIVTAGLVPLRMSMNLKLLEAFRELAYADFHACSTQGFLRETNLIKVATR